MTIKQFITSRIYDFIFGFVLGFCFFTSLIFWYKQSIGSNTNTKIKSQTVISDKANTYTVDNTADYTLTVYYYKQGKIISSVQNVTDLNIRTMYDCDSVVAKSNIHSIDVLLLEKDILYTSTK